MYVVAAILGGYGLVAKNTEALAFSSEMLLLPGLIQAQIRRNRRRDRGKDQGEDDE